MEYYTNYNLEVSDITKTYDTFTLDHISFSLPSGSIMGFIGENGAGKTTTLKALLGLVKKDAGSVHILGKEYNKSTELELKEQLGIVFDECRFPENLSAVHIGKIMASIYKNWDKALYSRYLSAFSLSEKKLVKEYSRGMKMKLSIATALSHRPRLLLLDEPTSGLDPVIRNEILDVFLEYIQDEGNSILLSSHITSDLEKIADYITFIHQGKLVFSKYLLTLLLVAIGGIASSIYGYLMLFILKESITSEFLLGCLTSISIGLTSFFILLPIVFQFGVEKARYIMFLLFMIPFLLLLAMERFGFLEQISLDRISDTVFSKYLLLGEAGLVLFAFFIFLPLSLWIVNRKEY